MQPATFALLLASSALLAVPQHTNIPVGVPAPDFTLPDDRGRDVRLFDLRGQYVVLEWHEKGCPYVAKHYRTGHMQKLQQKWMQRGVQWLMLTSSTEGSHSYLTPEESQAYLSELRTTPTAHLLDTAGRVGKQYGALTALHMVVIAPDGTVIYNGAIDDKPTTSAADLPPARNYIDDALTAAFAGRAVETPASTPYGCSIHYGRER